MTPTLIHRMPLSPRSTGMALIPTFRSCGRERRTPAQSSIAITRTTMIETVEQIPGERHHARRARSRRGQVGQRPKMRIHAGRTRSTDCHM